MPRIVWKLAPPSFTFFTFHFTFFILYCSDTADAKLRIFNLDGSEDSIGGNAIRCVAKYLFDNGIVKKRRMRIETLSGIRNIHLTTRNGEVSSVTVDGKKSFENADMGTRMRRNSSVRHGSVRRRRGDCPEWALR
jgi:diaminopimelate epimerase